MCWKSTNGPPPSGLSSFLCEVVVSCGWWDASGEGDSERVECLFPALGMGSEFSSSRVSDVANGQVEDLQHGVVGGEMSSGFGDFAKLIVQRLDGVGGVYDLSDRTVKGEERDESLPVVSP